MGRRRHLPPHAGGPHRAQGCLLELRDAENSPRTIIRLVPEERKIGLSIRALKSDEFRSDWEAYQESTGTGEATLGEHIRYKG